MTVFGVDGPINKHKTNAKLHVPTNSLKEKLKVLLNLDNPKQGTDFRMALVTWQLPLQYTIEMRASKCCN